MNFFINQQKQKKAKQLRDMHSTRPKDYWRYLNNLKDKHTTKTPPLQDFYDNYDYMKLTFLQTQKPFTLNKRDSMRMILMTYLLR